MEIIKRKIQELIPYANNTRTHSDNQVSQIASSIKEFGFTNPVLIDEQGGIIAGHGRVMGAKLLQLDEVPTITLSGLTEAQVKAYIIADNKIGLNSGWDEELLKVELSGLSDMGYALDVIGFNIDELNNLELGFDEEIEEDFFSDEEDQSQEDKIKLSVVCDNDTDKQQLKEELLSRGFLCQ